MLRPWPTTLPIATPPAVAAICPISPGALGAAPGAGAPLVGGGAVRGGGAAVLGGGALRGGGGDGLPPRFPKGPSCELVRKYIINIYTI